MGDTRCVFCLIVAGEAERSVVHEDEPTLAFMDIAPVNPGHLIIVPKHHATYLADLPTETGSRMMDNAILCAAALRATTLRCEGINLFLADGAAAGQEVFHTHLHVLPRYAEDGFSLNINYPEAPARVMLDEQAALIASHIQR